MNIFSGHNFLGRFFNLIFDLVVIHILWIICSLPVITIGASTTATYYALMKRIRRDEGYIWKNFFISFKYNLRQSTILWLILLLIGAILITDLRIGFAANGTIAKVMIFSSSLLFVPYSFILLYIFPVQAKFENKVKDNLKNATLMSVANIGYTLLMLFIVVLFVFFLFRSKAFIGLFIVMGFGLLPYLLSNIFVIIFRKYLPREYEDDAKAQGIDPSKI